MSNLDSLLQLHEVVEIHYYVDHTVAQLYTQDGNRLVLEGKGNDIPSALADLDRQCIHITLQVLRKMPAIGINSSNSAIRKL